jgi:hypothetical protein
MKRRDSKKGTGVCSLSQPIASATEKVNRDPHYKILGIPLTIPSDPDWITVSNITEMETLVDLEQYKHIFVLDTRSHYLYIKGDFVLAFVEDEN